MQTTIGRSILRDDGHAGQPKRKTLLYVWGFIRQMVEEGPEKEMIRFLLIKFGIICPKCGC